VTIGYRSESRKSTPVLNSSPSPRPARSVASRSPACHAGVQNHAWFVELPRFVKDFDQLSADEQERFRQAVARFVEDLERGQAFRRSLRVKGVQGTKGIFEMTWASDGRATFHYGEPVREGAPHVVWRRVGTHAVLSNP
jgi:hypothetical protein